MNDLDTINFESMTHADFEKYLPEFFGNNRGRVSEDPRLQKFLSDNPDCAALVRDLEAIAEHAKSLFEPEEMDDPSPDVWNNIQNKLKEGNIGEVE